MWGAIIGDLAGSTYEFGQIKQVTNININKLILDDSFYSDDTILTIAILDAMINDKNFEYYLKKYGKDYLNYKPKFSPYFKSSFSPGFIKWVNGNEKGTSIGNGAMMRISPVGYLAKTEEEVIKFSRLATEPSHNSNEAIDNATVIAMIIFLARHEYSKEKIIKYLNIKYSFKIFEKFNSTCNETINNCLYALFESNSFEESLKTVISYGGDTDTNACIVGSMAEAMYGIDNVLIQEANKKIPREFVKKLLLSYSIKNN